MAQSDIISKRIALVKTWLGARLAPEQQAWLDGQVTRIKSAPDGAALAMAIGLAPRKLGKADLALSKAELEAASALRPGLDPSNWSVDQTARILFLLASFDGDESKFAARFDRLMTTGEVGEHIALLRGLPLYPAPQRLVTRAAEGLRSNVQPVFEAVAHASPFPREALSDSQWNHMVLKALFIGSHLAPIQGLDERRNSELAEMMIDYAHERWAAARPVSPELWRCVGPFARKRDVQDLAKVLHEGSANERRAAALALAECPLPTAASSLGSAPELAGAINNGTLTWRDVA